MQQFVTFLGKSDGILGSAAVTLSLGYYVLQRQTDFFFFFSFLSV